MTLGDLPRYSVVEVRPDCCWGHFDPSPWVGENWIAGLYLGNGRFLWGRFRLVDTKARSCSFFPKNTAELTTISLTGYPFMDGYWGERAELVLDESRRWMHAKFEATDMIAFRAADGTSMATRSSPEAPQGGKLVAGGWDHEHCFICQKKIGRGGEPTGYFSAPDEWVCESCYHSFVVPQSLAFCHST